MIGILALQGAFAAHARALSALALSPVFVRAPADLEGLGGLVLPGGESTVQRDLIGRLGLETPIRDLVARGVPALGTCAGLILAASYGFIDVTVERNAWGRQVDSFEATSDRGRPIVCIRAPRITGCGPDVEILDTLEGEPILVREGNVIGATFHPELTADRALHSLAFDRPSEVDPRSASDRKDRHRSIPGAL